jgi:hypothetical protein
MAIRTTDITFSCLGAKSKSCKSNFIGDDTLPIPPASQPPCRTPDPHGPRLHSGGPQSDPSAWSDERQQQFLRALIGGTPPAGSAQGPDVPNTTEPRVKADDPLLALMSHLAAGAGAGKGLGSVLSQPEARPKNLTRRLLPILHCLGTCGVLRLWMEPETFWAQNSTVISSSSLWSRWARLATGSVEGSLWNIETLFSGLSFPWELTLHSM